MVYRNMENYLWLGVSASSFFNQQWITNNPALFERFNVSTLQPSGFRRTNTANIKQYLEKKWIDEKEVHVLNTSDLLIEEFFLRLRTREGIADISKFIPLLVPTHQSLLAIYIKEWLVEFDGTRLQLTDEGMNVYNSIITDLLQKI
jgi:coproporphyrinogen III oxidase-like Fe-S oxidoreductase